MAKKEDKSFREILSYWAVKEPLPKPTSAKLKPSTSNSSISQLSESNDQIQPQHIQENNDNIEKQHEEIQQQIDEQKLVEDIIKQVEDLGKNYEIDQLNNNTINNNTITVTPEISEPTVTIPSLTTSYTLIGESPDITTTTNSNNNSNHLSISENKNSNTLSISNNTINLRTSNNWANISRTPTNPYMTINDGQQQQQPDEIVNSSSETSYTSVSYSSVGMNDMVVGDDQEVQQQQQDNSSDVDSSHNSYSLYTISSSSYTSYNKGNTSGGYLYAKEVSPISTSSSSAYTSYNGSNSSGSSGYLYQEGSRTSSSYLAYTTANNNPIPAHFNIPHEHNIPKVDVFKPLTLCQKISATHSWNENFQMLLSMPDSVEKYEYLSKVSNDFVYCANTFGKIIISERNLPDEQKTIKPLSLGGVAGGYKYKCQDIIFKFVVDVEIAPGLWMYGDTSRSDEKAQKSAGHELKGLNHFMEHSNGTIRFPLMAIIDYGGYRLLAISNLPLSKKTIVYGSNDGGKNIHNSDNTVEQEMVRLAASMNIKGHSVGLITPTLIYGPGDIEVHKGTDGHYYMIDFARAFPPEYPQQIRDRIGREIFYAMLRPELVSKYEVPLSPDAFSGWQNGKDEDQSNLEVMEATVKLHTQVIPECVTMLEQALDFECPSNAMLMKSQAIAQGESVSIQNDYQSKTFQIQRIVNLIHASGINLRYIGVICQKVNHRLLKKVLMTELVSRVWKKIIKARLREKMETSNRPSEEPTRVLSEVFDILQNQKLKYQYKDFWSSNTQGSFKYAAIRAFPNCFSVEEFNSNYDLRHSIDVKLLVMRIIQMMNVRINPEAYKQFLSNPKYVISNHDIEDIEPIVKYPTVVDYAAGSHLIYQAQGAMAESSSLEALRWIDMAHNKMHSALRSIPLSAKLIMKQAGVFVLKSNMTTNIKESIAHLTTSGNLLRQANNIHPNNADILSLWGLVHLKMATHYLFHNSDFVNFKKNLDTAGEKLEESLNINTDSLPSMLKKVTSIDKFCNCSTNILEDESVTSTTTVIPDVDKQKNESCLLYEIISIVYLAKIAPSDSKLKTFIPLSIGHLKKIPKLDIPISIRRIIDDTIIAELIENLPNLFHLEIHSMSLTPRLSYVITQLKYLTSISLVDSNISSRDAIENDITNLNQFLSALLKGCPMLTSISLCSRGFEDNDFVDIAPRLVDLTSLSLTRGSITNKTLIEFAPYLSNLTNLDIRISSNQINDDGIVPIIESCNNLTKLTLSNGSISDRTGQAIVKKAKQLEYLSLCSSSKISSGVLAEIVRCAESLIVLDLSATAADHSLFEALEFHGAKQLCKLYLEQTNIASCDDFNPFLSLAAIEPVNLKVVHLPKHVSGEYSSIWTLLGKLPKLESLKLPPQLHLPTLMGKYKEYVENDLVINDVPLSEITHLDMFWSTVSLHSLTQLLEMTPLLESLSLSYTTFVNEQSFVIQLNDSILAAIGPLLANLKELNLSNLPIEKRMIPCLVSRCTQLRKIHLYNCKPLNSQAIYDLGREFPHIKFFS